jgi:carbamoyl-phosphate synthase large subunit
LRVEKPTGVIVQFGGDAAQSALDLQRAGVPIIGTSPDSIDLAEDRKRFGELLRKLDIPQPGTERPILEKPARGAADRISRAVRPSYG